MEISRRDLIKMGLLGSAAMYLPIERWARASDYVSLVTPPKPPFTYDFRKPLDIDLSRGGKLKMRMVQRNVSLLGGPSNITNSPLTPFWVYEAMRYEPGDGGAPIDFAPGTAINPTLHNKKGVPIDITHVNALPAVHPVHNYESWTSVHLHGSASLPQFDGYANDVTKPGEQKTYTYPNAQGARTLWYHDHGVHRTAKNAYAGLAAQYHLHDDYELAQDIPVSTVPGMEEYDNPLILRDAMFEKSGILLWDDNDQSSLMGDFILVNGVPWPKMPVKKRKYRFRILNGSISRSFNLSLNNPYATMTVIGTDGGFLPTPQQVTSLKVGMAERYDILIDFSSPNIKPGTSITLQSSDVKNNVDYLHTRKIMRFDVTSAPFPTTRNGLPTPFAPKAPSSGSYYMGPEQVMGLEASMAVRRRTLEFKKSDSTGEWNIDGKTWNSVYDNNEVVSNPQPGEIEVWDLVNKSGGWFHPVHIHQVDFRILSRNGAKPRPYELGPKDVAYVGEGETVRVVAKFGPHEGRYMIHCHNLVHEDHDMMSQFRVGRDINDPVKSAPATTANPADLVQY